MIQIKSHFNTVDRVKELIHNLQYLEKQKDGSLIEIKEIDFTTPLSITPVAALINKKSLKHNYRGENSSYLKTIRFPEGIEAIKLRRTRRTYLPIIHLTLLGLDEIEMSRKLGELNSKYLNLLKENVIADRVFIERVTENTFGLLFQEMLDNIQEHADAENVYLFAQYWPKNNACEFCLLDDGKGLYGSLKKAGRDVKDSEDALKKILETGLSAKTEYGEVKRGTGIRTTRALITNKEMNGEFLIMSGNVAFLHSSQRREIFFRLKNYDWHGTLIIGRLNKPVTKFDWTRYVQ